MQRCKLFARVSVKHLEISKKYLSFRTKVFFHSKSSISGFFFWGGGDGHNPCLLGNASFFLKIKKGLEYSDTKEYAQIFCKLFAKVSVKNLDIFQNSFPLKPNFFLLSK